MVIRLPNLSTNRLAPTNYPFKKSVQSAKSLIKTPSRLQLGIVGVAIFVTGSFFVHVFVESGR